MANSSKWLPNVEGTAKVWSILNGTGTIAGRDDFGVTSYTDNATGDYTVTFSNNFGTASYAAVFGELTYTGSAVAQILGSNVTPPATGSLRILSLTFDTPYGGIDDDGVVVHISGDLA